MKMPKCSIQGNANENYADKPKVTTTNQPFANKRAVKNLLRKASRTITPALFLNMICLGGNMDTSKETLILHFNLIVFVHLLYFLFSTVVCNVCFEGVTAQYELDECDVCESGTDVSIGGKMCVSDDGVMIGNNYGTF